MELINRKSKLPYYQQLYDILRKKIANGEWKPGDLIPPESSLIDQYQVSRNTVRNVLDMLVKEGRIYRQRGLGSFVAFPTFEEALVHIVNFTEDMRQRGFQPSSRILSCELIPAPEDIAEKLMVPAGEELACLRRLRIADDKPMSIEEASFVHRYCPGVLNRHDYTRVSLRESMEADYGIRWQRAKQAIRAINSTKEQAHLLGIPAGSALLFIERVAYSDQDIPMEFLRIYYSGDRYSLFNELTA
ncbi:MAG: GntR family transcriptional regulator [Anaerolineaceae bacterium]|nr:GntR family transcriptional regulator [Anaerolineaceae bacterium]